MQQSVYKNKTTTETWEWERLPIKAWDNELVDLIGFMVCVNSNYKMAHIFDLLLVNVMTVTSGTVNLCPSIIESDQHTVQPLFFKKYKYFIRLSTINQYIIQCRMLHTFDT